MNALVYPTPHLNFDPGCYGCGFSRDGNCGDVCNACGCRWDMDLFDEPNPQHDACDPGDCDCHTWTLVDSRARARQEDRLEAAWRDAGYADSMAVWQAELR